MLGKFYDLFPVEESDFYAKLNTFKVQKSKNVKHRILNEFFPYEFSIMFHLKHNFSYFQFRVYHRLSIFLLTAALINFNVVNFAPVPLGNLWTHSCIILYTLCIKYVVVLFHNKTYILVEFEKCKIYNPLNSIRKYKI